METTTFQNHIEKETFVFTTREYQIFKTLNGNRAINQGHLLRLKDSMKQRYLYSPIIVNSEMEVIDGQHRLQAAKDLGLPVNYIICNTYSNQEVHRYNVNLKNWTTTDFMESYCQMGNENYLLYKKFISIYGFGHRASISILMGTDSTAPQEKDFREGRFVVNSYEYACKIADDITIMKNYYDGYKRRSFIYAMIHLIRVEKIDMNKLLSKLKYQSTKLVHCVTTKDYINLLMGIYKFYQRKK